MSASVAADLLKLRCAEARYRIEALTHIQAICEAFGPQRLISELLPFLKEFEDDEEEVMLQLASALFTISQYISEKKNNLYDVIPYFSLVLDYEDFSVIDKGLNCFEELLKSNSIRHDSVFNLVLALFSVDRPMARVSAIRICCRLNNHIPERHFPQLMEVLRKCSKSPNLIVRRETAKKIRRLISENGALKQEAFIILVELMNDEQDSVQVAVAETLCFQVSSKGHFNTFIWPVLSQLIESKSWRVRYSISGQLHSILSSVYMKYRASVVDDIVKYIIDPEMEVSIRTVDELKKVSEILDCEEVSERILPAVEKLLSHENEAMRESLAKSVPYLVKVIDNSHIPQYTEIINKLLKDERPEVRMHVLANIDPLAETIEPKQILNLVSPVLVHLLNDKTWTIRNDSLISLETLVYKLGENFASDLRILNTFKEKLMDKVYDIRINTIYLLKNLAKFFGQEFADKKIWPIFPSFANNKNYLYRSNYLKGMAQLSPYISQPLIIKELPTLSQLCQDQVPNIRWQALLTLLVISKLKDEESINAILLSQVNAMKNDEDIETKKLACAILSEGVESSFTKFFEIGGVKA